MGARQAAPPTPQWVRRPATPVPLVGAQWQDLGLVFPTSRGTLLDPANLRRSLRTVTEQAGLGRWHPHELRHSAASLLSAAGVPLEEVADVLGHASTRVTSATYRHRQTRPSRRARGRWSRSSLPLATPHRIR